ncbi:sugar-binding domain-containing protein [Limosilactobacillus caecicola]|uniref:sugar-binding domain-containing protein n=1 Tax=Limosilactobacillus caecicola TaxID=2941332 RepID=UPI0023AAEBC5|nr:sugar-binding domain-containing protein [Limosilactobacillus caecicola]
MRSVKARTMAISLAALKATRQSILVAGGTNKLPAIRAALNGGYANVLVTDLNDAEALLREQE